MDERRDSSADTVAGTDTFVASPDVDDADRRATRSLVVAYLLAILLALAAGVTSAAGAPDLTSAESIEESSAAAGSAPSEPCRISEEVAAVLAAAETPWDYMLVLGYPKDVIGDVLNERAESVMEEHANGQVRWDPAANDGIYSDDAQLVLIMGADDEIVEITDTQQVMELLGMEAACASGTGDVVLPVVS